MQEDKKLFSQEEKIDPQEIVELTRKLSDKEKERFYFMLKGVAMINDEMQINNQTNKREFRKRGEA